MYFFVSMEVAMNNDKNPSLVSALLGPAAVPPTGKTITFHNLSILSLLKGIYQVHIVNKCVFSGKTMHKITIYDDLWRSLK